MTVEPISMSVPLLSAIAAAASSDGAFHGRPAQVRDGAAVGRDVRVGRPLPADDVVEHVAVAHDGAPLMALYEHMAPVAPPSTKPFSYAGRYDSKRSCAEMA